MEFLNLASDLLRLKTQMHPVTLDSPANPQPKDCDLPKVRRPYVEIASQFDFFFELGELTTSIAAWKSISEAK
jgi:hypothetical protein